MPTSIHFYQDQNTGEGCGTLNADQPILYCRFGRAEINATPLAAGDAVYVGEDFEITSTADWSQVWRWDVDLPNAERALLVGEGVLSMHRMSRVIGMLDMAPGSEWLFRLDQITAPAGRDGGVSHSSARPWRRPCARPGTP